MNSGIQRVVRNITSHTQSAKTNLECVPTIFLEDRVYRLTKLKPGQTNIVIAELLEQLDLVFNKIELVRHQIRSSPTGSFRRAFLRKFSLAIFKVLHLLVRGVRSVMRRLDRRVNLKNRTEPLIVNHDDIVVLLDSSWHSDIYYDQVDAVRLKCACVVAVIYDVIPLTNPEFCEETTNKYFRRYIHWIAENANGYMAISKAVRDQSRKVIAELLSLDRLNDKWFDHFYLGSELDLATTTPVRRQIKSIFSPKSSVYLMVSTIEPRKNHDYLINAFEQIWKTNSDVILCFIGRVGWKSENQVERIQSHPEHNKRFFMLNDVNDTELEFAYRHSKALVFSSITEGFGLPLIEAMQRGLHAMASDIQVFREIGGKFCAYFDLDEASSLAKLIVEFESTNKFPSELPLDNFVWMGWQEASVNFIEKINLNIHAAEIE